MEAKGDGFKEVGAASPLPSAFWCSDARGLNGGIYTMMSGL